MSLAQQLQKTVIIVGGVAGGATAAARLRRLSETMKIVLFERGEFPSFANCGLPYYAGGVIAKRESLLVQTAAGLQARFAFDVRTRHEVTAINRAAKTVAVRNLVTGGVFEQAYDALILATGAKPMRPPIPGLEDAAAAGNLYTLRTIPDTDAIKARADALLAEAAAAPAGAAKPHAVVVGGGFIGVEMAEVMAARGLDVTLVELSPQVLPPMDFEMAQIVHAHLADNGVHLRLGVSVTGFDATGVVAAAGGRGVGLRLSDGSTLQSDLTLLAVGVVPDTELARAAGLTLGPRGAVVTNEHMQTSDPAVYAVGDAVMTGDGVLGPEAPQLWVPLAGPANRQAHVVADHICGRPTGDSYAGALGTSIVKVFKLAAGGTGLSEKAAARAGRPVRVVHVHPNSHAGAYTCTTTRVGWERCVRALRQVPAAGAPYHTPFHISSTALPSPRAAGYYPGAAAIALKLVFDPSDGRVLGAQAVGADGVDKRLDVLATAIHGRMSVHDLTELELSYAPPFGSAKDPVNIAGYAACNLLDGVVDNVQWSDLAGLQLVAPEALTPAAAAATLAAAAASPPGAKPKPRAVLVDVREPAELKAGAIPGAINIPLPQLRTRLGELEPARTAGVPVLVSCAVGMRGYMGARILTAAGFSDVRNVDGGYKTYAAATRVIDQE